MPIVTVLLDVEGTVVPVVYIKRTLLPYAHQRLPGFIRENSAKEEVRRALNLLSQEQREGAPGDWNAEALRTIEELIWREGFFSGELCSEIFADVPLAFRNWRGLDRRVGAYSLSHAGIQELFFRYSEWGDLTPFIDSFFDSRIGPKNAAQSYQRIVREMKCRPEEVLFASDVAEQLDAAQEAGMATALVIRTDAPLVSSTHRVVSDLSVLALE